MPATRFYDVIRTFTLRSPSGAEVVARPGDSLRRDGEAYALVRGDTDAEVQVQTSPSEYGRYVQTRL